MKQWKQLWDKVSNDENQHHILWCPSIIIFPIRPVMPRGKENLMALLHYPQKVTITRTLEKVTFKTGKNFASTVFETKKRSQKQRRLCDGLWADLRSLWADSRSMVGWFWSRLWVPKPTKLNQESMPRCVKLLYPSFLIDCWSIWGSIWGQAT